MDALNDQLTRPYNMMIGYQVPEGQSGALTVEGQGSFNPTGFTQEDIQDAEWAEDDTGKGAVRILLTEAGATKLKQITTEHTGGVLGLFVHGALMSKMGINGPIDTLIIRNIPSPVVAQIFADDVLVGIHVQIVPVP